MAVVHHLADALPGLAAVGVLIYWSADYGGYFPRDWYPGTILLLGMLAVTVAAAPSAFGDIPRLLQVALAALAAYTAWTFLSITWADAKGVAWDGANRTLLYLVLFTLLARPAADTRSAGIVLGGWVLAVLALAIVVLIELPGVLGDASGGFGKGLSQPLGYTNANAALWLMAAWPALLLAACRDVPAWLRGVFAGGIVVLADASLLSQSRGTLISAAVCLLVMFAAVPGRMRLVVMLLPAAIAIAATGPHVFDRVDAATSDPAAVADLGGLAVPVLLASMAAGIAAALASRLVDRRSLSARTERTVRRAIAATGIVLAIGGATAAIVAVGDPVDQARDTWREFKQTGAPTQDGSPHLTAGFGGARYDYYRVALDVFGEHPLIGIGADNFADDYRARGTVGERPSSPHSLEIRTLLQTGIVGAVLLFTALGAGLVAAHAGTRGPPMAQAVAAGGALTFVYWAVQGSADWFWEFPALGGAAFAFLALAGSVAGPRPAPQARDGTRRRAAGVIAGGMVGAAAAASLAAPWIADIEIRRAAKDWRAAPDAAFNRLDRAADLNPLSERPGLEAGTIALQLGSAGRAREAFEQVVDRNPRNVYATLALGAIASHSGRRAEAMRLLRRALDLSPGDGAVLSAIAQAQEGRVDLEALTREVFSRARAYVQGAR